jgi:hypothetical protein
LLIGRPLDRGGQIRSLDMLFLASHVCCEKQKRNGHRGNNHFVSSHWRSPCGFQQSLHAPFLQVLAEKYLKEAPLFGGRSVPKRIGYSATVCTLPPSSSLTSPPGDQPCQLLSLVIPYALTSLISKGARMRARKLVTVGGVVFLVLLGFSGFRVVQSFSQSSSLYAEGSPARSGRPVVSAKVTAPAQGRILAAYGSSHFLDKCRLDFVPGRSQAIASARGVYLSFEEHPGQADGGARYVDAAVATAFSFNSLRFGR